MFGWAIKAEIIPWYQKRWGEQRKTDPLVHTALWDNIQIICKSILHHRAIYILTHAEPMCLCFSTWREICSSVRDRRKIGGCGWGKKIRLGTISQIAPCVWSRYGRKPDALWGYFTSLRAWGIKLYTRALKTTKTPWLSQAYCDSHWGFWEILLRTNLWKGDWASSTITWSSISIVSWKRLPPQLCTGTRQVRERSDTS